MKLPETIQNIWNKFEILEKWNTVYARFESKISWFFPSFICIIWNDNRISNIIDDNCKNDRVFCISTSYIMCLVIQNSKFTIFSASTDCYNIFKFTEFGNFK